MSRTPSRYVFVGGLHRSGTSLLARLLAAHPDASGLTGTGVQEDEGQHLQDVYDPAHRLGGPGRFARRAQLGPLSPPEAAEARRRLLESWDPFWDLERAVLVEKSPPNLVRTRYLQSIFPDAAFVVIVRHPIAVALSTRKWITDSPAELVRHWVAAHRILLGDAPHVDRLTLVRYEDLVAGLRDVLRALFGFVGLREAPVSTAVRADLNDDYLAAWRGDASVAHLEGDANAFGYSLISPRAMTPPSPFVASLLTRAAA